MRNLSTQIDLSRMNQMKRELTSDFDPVEFLEIMNVPEDQIIAGLDQIDLQSLLVSRRDPESKLMKAARKKFNQDVINDIKWIYDDLAELIKLYKEYHYKGRRFASQDTDQICRAILRKVEEKAREKVDGSGEVRLENAKEEYRIIERVVCDYSAFSTALNLACRRWRKYALREISRVKTVNKATTICSLSPEGSAKTKAETKLRQLVREKFAKTVSLTDLRSLYEAVATDKGNKLSNQIMKKWELVALRELEEANSINALRKIWNDLPTIVGSKAKERLEQVAERQIANLRTLDAARKLLDFVANRLPSDIKLLKSIENRFEQLALKKAQNAKTVFDLKIVARLAQKGGQARRVALLRMYEMI